MIFIDTGAFYARCVKADAHHAAATRAWPTLEQYRLFTSSMVIWETTELLARRTDASFAVESVARILSEPHLSILRPDADDEAAGLELMLKYADQPIGFADCVSMVLMRKKRIRRVFSFDRHFRSGGVSLWPGPN